MCNPPFYDSVEEVAQSAEAKEWGPNAVSVEFRKCSFCLLNISCTQVCTGADIEMIAPGGETTFVRRMVEESLNHGVRCRYVVVIFSAQD
jgi:23S rRNA A1618 N6-methylase RlmF